MFAGYVVILAATMARRCLEALLLDEILDQAGAGVGRALARRFGAAPWLRFAA